MTASDRVKHAADKIKCPVAPDAELQAAESEFRAKAGVQRLIRGKYILWFFVACLEALRAAIPTLFPRHEKVPGSSGGLGVGNAMMLIGPRAKCPTALRSFLNDNFLDYIRTVGSV